MLILGIILFGMLIGAAAQLILGRAGGGINWPMAFATGLIGSFVGGLLVSLVSGDGLALRPSGIIGSLLGAVIVTALWQWWRGRNQDPTPRRSGQAGQARQSKR
ncbi:MAG: GlsB/YeaQ/YmgE family stress response membrane protein [Dermatophilaceae bacterium]